MDDYRFWVDHFFRATLLTKTIYVILAALSVTAWAIIIRKIRILRRCSRGTRAFQDLYHKGRRNPMALYRHLLANRNRFVSPLTTVFLSGCETGAASSWAPGVLAGRDLATLAEALLYAGAGSVVATLWPIQDRPAAEFAGFFYEALGETGAARALAEAQRRMLSAPDTRAPFYWAGYRVSGGGARLANPD